MEQATLAELKLMKLRSVEMLRIAAILQNQARTADDEMVQAMLKDYGITLGRTVVRHKETGCKGVLKISGAYHHRDYLYPCLFDFYPLKEDGTISPISSRKEASCVQNVIHPPSDCYSLEDSINTYIRAIEMFEKTGESIERNEAMCSGKY